MCRDVYKRQEEGSPKRYVGRDMSCCDRLWSALCDAPYGCCEPDCHLSKAVEIIVCDKNWNEQLRDGNDRELYPESFPTLEETHDSEWAAVKKQIPGVTKEGFSTWIEAKMPPNVSDINRLNWQAPTHYDVIETKAVSYTHLDVYKRQVHRQFIGHSPKLLDAINKLFVPKIFDGFPK